MTLDEIIQLSREVEFWPEIDLVLDERYSPFPNDAHQYIRYALEELNAYDSRPSQHLLINATSHIKRALDNRLDTVLMYWGIYKYVKDKNLKFDVKLLILGEIGLATPGYLAKINTYRNNSEHEYTTPDYEKVKDFYDISTLFILYTDPFLKFNNNEFNIYSSSMIPFKNPHPFLKSVEEFYIFFKFDRQSGSITLTFHDQKVVMPESKRPTIQLTIHDRESLQEYCKAVKWTYELLDMFL